MDPFLPSENAGHETPGDSRPVGLYAKLFDNSPDPHLLHEGGLILDANRAVCRLLEAEDRASLVGRPLLDFVDPEQRAAVAEGFARIAETRGPVPVWETRLVRPSGRVTDVALVSEPIEHEGRLLIVTTVQDITVRREAEDAHARSERLYRSLIELASDGIFVVRGRDRLVEVNAQACAMTGYSREELLKMEPVRLVTPESLLREPGRIWDALRRGEALTFERTLVRKDGSTFVAEINIKRIGQDLLQAIARDVTARRAAEEERRRLAAIVASSRDAIIGSTVEGAVTSWNAGAEALYGFSAAEAIGQPLAMLLPPEGRRDLEELQAVLARREPVVRAEMVHVRRDGAEVVVSFVMSPVEDADGNVVGGAAIVRDISAQKEAEAVIRRSEARLRLALEAARMGTWSLDLKHRTATWSRETEAILGMRQAQGAHQDAFYRLVHPEDLPQVKATIEYVVHTGEPLSLEYRIVPEEGTVRWIYCEGRLAHDAEGTPVHMTGILLDISERKASEEALRRSEARQRALLEGIPDLIIRLDADGHYLDVHAPDPEQLVLPAEDLLDRTVRQALPKDVAELFLAATQEALRTSTVQRMEYELTPLSGRAHAFECRVVPLGDNDVLAVIRDITERRVYERELVAAKEQAEEMNRLKSAFLANMSHEIRTPLTTIIGFAEVLAEELPGEAGDLVRLIQQGAGRLMETLNSVLDLAQIESGTLKLRPASMDVITQVQSTLALFRHQAERRNLYLALQVECERPLTATMDAAALHRVLANLVSNALKFTERGGVTVTVSSEPDHVVLRITDTGIGISPEFMPHVYEAFLQEAHGFARPYEGSGLGLSIVLRLVDLMRGRITVESHVNAGTAFTVTLPRG